ncbi:MAG: phage tail sheath protein, partial [bacterium]|nr:phage tail sheath protein [bacterium]
KEDVNILVAPEMATDDAVTLLNSLAESQENDGKDVIAVVGSDGASVEDITGDVTANKRLILAAPGIQTKETLIGADGRVSSSDVTLAGRYTAAPVAGLLSTLMPQSSPTNKVVLGVGKLARRFSYGQTKDLINGGVLVLEERLGVRVVRGISTEMASNGPFKQITTRRIVDFAKAGIRRVSNPF